MGMGKNLLKKNRIILIRAQIAGLIRKLSEG
jgi:hypothetical protein